MTITADGIVDLAERVRKHQVEYFRTRSDEALRLSRAAEAVLDKSIATYREQQRGIVQQEIPL